MKNLLRLVDWLSGEWMLHGRSNSGAIIFLRSLLVAFYVFFATLVFKCAIDPETSSSFSLHQMRLELRDHVSWFGAIFAAAYVGLYSRYASQWSYVAGLYNQIMATASSLPDERHDNETLLNWQAAFIEDAYHLHLDRKEVFSIVIKQMLENPALLKCFIESAPTPVVDKVLERNGLIAPAP